MRELKLQVETVWRVEAQDWDVTLYAVISPGVRYMVANFQSTFQDPMVDVVNRLGAVFE